MDLRDTKYKTVPQCFVDARISYCRLLQCCIENLPLLENISITDLGKRRMISYSGERIIAMRNVLTLPYEKFKHELLGREHVVSMSETHNLNIPLKLLISGHVMGAITLKLRERDDLHNYLRLLSTDILDDDFVGDKEESLYNEAINEILEKF
ncbi:hypothetical protein Tco_0410657 [Tanacetum coccineum]